MIRKNMRVPAAPSDVGQIVDFVHFETKLLEKVPKFMELLRK